MNNDLRPINTLPNFKRFCMTIGELPTSYLETMTYYEMLVWFTEYMKNTIIPTINNNGLAVQELQDKYIELKSFVDNYFDNLDVQEEINNKLDEMVESGQLQEIISDYLNSKAVFGFDTLNDMLSSSNLINGSYAETLGFYNKNDGGSALYQIRNKSISDIIDNKTIIQMNNENLVAEIINKDKINIKQLGAKGNGIDNDTESLSIALNKYNNIYIPNGTYLIHNSLNVRSNTTITGESKNAIIKFDSYENINEAKYIFNCSGINDVTIKNITLSGLMASSEIDETYCSYYGLRFYNSENLLVENCKFIDFYRNGGSIRNSKNITIFKSIFENNHTNGIAFTQNIENLVLTNNIFKNNPYQNINFEDNQTDYIAKNVVISNNNISNDNGGLWAISLIAPSIDDNTKFKHHDIIIRDNIINNIQVGITVNYSYNVEISNNTITNCKECIKVNANINIENKSYNYLIKNNKINSLTSSQFALFIESLKNSLIINNDITGSASTSNSRGIIVLFNTEYITFDNNYIHDASNKGINFIGSNTNTNIFNNTFKDLLTMAIRISEADDKYYHFDNNKYIDTADNMTYTIRFTADVNYIIIEREIKIPETLYFTTTNLKNFIVTRNNNSFTPST